MRELKFRAFDAVLGMRPVIDIDGRCRWWKVRAGGHVYRLSEGALMQYTGLNDANGVEIYEGDLVEWDDDSDGKYWRVAVVEFNPDLQFRIVANTRHKLSAPHGHIFRYGSFIYTDTENWLTVIGNIYEHSNLLEAK